MAPGRYILDTHCLIWFQENNPRIHTHVLKIIEDPANIILFSQLSLFELAIKQKIGKLPHFSASIEEVYNQAVNDGFTFLNIQNTHIINYDNVTLHESHRDPFDRLLVATAISEDAIILSTDGKFNLYKDVVKMLW
jgi:PIN domain nuclease of toxin-antitoxin system